MPTKIEWSDETWNPTVGCSYASDGCRGCYAARDAFGRLRNVPAYAGLAHQRTPDELPRFTGEVRFLPERLDQPTRWKRPRRVFVDSMSDLFHPEVLRGEHEGFPFLAHVFARMVAAPQHTFQVLTKRPQIMRTVLAEPRFRLDVNALLLGLGHPVMPGGMTDPDFRWPTHLWMGTSVEDQRNAELRIPHLLATPAAVRFLSIEPLLGPVDLAASRPPGCTDEGSIDWVIVGGESGPRARAMHPQWVRDLRDQCVGAGVPFLFKQWGEWAPAARSHATHIVEMDGTCHPRYGEAIVPTNGRHGVAVFRWGKKAAGRVLDGRTWDEFPP